MDDGLSRNQMMRWKKVALKTIRNIRQGLSPERDDDGEDEENLTELPEDDEISFKCILRAENDLKKLLSLSSTEAADTKDYYARKDMYGRLWIRILFQNDSCQIWNPMTPKYNIREYERALSKHLKLIRNASVGVGFAVHGNQFKFERGVIYIGLGKLKKP